MERPAVGTSLPPAFSCPGTGGRKLPSAALFLQVPILAFRRINLRPFAPGIGRSLRLLAGIASLAALGACATPQAGVEGETAIPFVSTNGIVDWRAAADDALYIRGVTGDWYLVRTMGPCPRLRTAISLGFVTRGIDQLDRGGSIIAQGQTCPVASVRRSAPPPGERSGGG